MSILIVLVCALLGYALAGVVGLLLGVVIGLLIVGVPQLR